MPRRPLVVVRVGVIVAAARAADDRNGTGDAIEARRLPSIEAALSCAMSRSDILRLGVIPALITIPLTAVRAWLEVGHPGAALTRLVSLNVVGFLWIVCLALRLRRQGARFRAYLSVLAAFCAIYRGAIGAVYALAWAQNWQTSGGSPLRYQREMIDAFTQMGIDAPEHASAVLVFVCSGLVPIVTHTILGSVVWLVIRFCVRPAGPSPALRGTR